MSRHRIFLQNQQTAQPAPFTPRAPTSCISPVAPGKRKSTNHSLKIAWAMASSVALVWRFSSILSSSAERIAAMQVWVGRSGIDSSKLGISAHFKLSKTAPAFRYFCICSHHSGPLTIQRRNGGYSFLPSDRSNTRFWPSANSRSGGTNAVSPGLHLRESTISWTWGFAFRVQAAKSSRLINLTPVKLIRPFLICGIATYG